MLSVFVIPAYAGIQGYRTAQPSDWRFDALLQAGTLRLNMAYLGAGLINTIRIKVL
jgi:hypothetical protein